MIERQRSLEAVNLGRIVNDFEVYIIFFVDLKVFANKPDEVVHLVWRFELSHLVDDGDQVLYVEFDDCLIATKFCSIGCSRST